MAPKVGKAAKAEVRYQSAGILWGSGTVATANHTVAGIERRIGPYGRPSSSISTTTEDLKQQRRIAGTCKCGQLSNPSSA